MKKIVFALVIMALIILSSAVAFSFGKNQVAEVIPSPIPSIVPTPVPSPSPSPTPIPTLSSVTTPTPTIDPVVQSRIKEIDQEIARIKSVIEEYKTIRVETETEINESLKSDNWSPAAGMAGAQAIQVIDEKINRMNDEIRSLQLEKTILIK